MDLNKENFTSLALQAFRDRFLSATWRMTKNVPLAAASAAAAEQLTKLMCQPIITEASQLLTDTPPESLAHLALSNLQNVATLASEQIHFHPLVNADEDLSKANFAAITLWIALYANSIRF